MKTVTELRNDLLDVYEQAKVGSIDRKVSQELANVAGKILKSAALEMSYNQFMKYDKKKIPFLEGSSKKSLE